MKYLLVLMLFSAGYAVSATAEIYECSGFVFSDFPCRTTPLRNLSPSTPLEKIETHRRSSKSPQSLHLRVTRPAMGNRTTKIELCDKIAEQLTDLRKRRRQGYKAREETSLDRQKSRLQQRHLTHCTQSRVRVIRGKRFSKK